MHKKGLHFGFISAAYDERMIFLLAALSAAPAIAAAPNDVIAALRARVKHVFVIYQENHSFDNYFGTYPGADNLASPEAQAHGFEYRAHGPHHRHPSEKRSFPGVQGDVQRPHSVL